MALTMESVDHWVPKSLQILETWLAASGAVQPPSSRCLCNHTSASMFFVSTRVSSFKSVLSDYPEGEAVVFASDGPLRR